MLPEKRSRIRKARVWVEDRVSAANGWTTQMNHGLTTELVDYIQTLRLMGGQHKRVWMFTVWGLAFQKTYSSSENNLPNTTILVCTTYSRFHCFPDTTQYPLL